LADFVLIHGTTQSPSGWALLVEALQQRGHAAYTVDLPTDGPDLKPAAYAAIIGRQVADVAEPILVAHSASGILLPDAARALRARHQVWLTAWVPDQEASLVQEVAASGGETIFNPDWIGKDPTSDPAIAAEFLFHDCDTQTLTWALTSLRLFFPRAAYQSRVPRAERISSTYIAASADRTIRPEWQRHAARERLGIESVEIAAGHCPHVSQPKALAEILAGVVA
jgi:pimeloyl-ACP methyl ester carboxylesterase